MPESLSCPQCSRQLRLPREVIGREVCCPMCRATFFAREAGTSPVAARPACPSPEEEPGPVEEPRPSRSARPPTGGRGWLIAGLLPAAAGIPLLAYLFGGAIGGTLGVLLWSLLALAVVGLGAIGEVSRFGRRRLRDLEARAAWAVPVLALGYLILGCGFWFDRHPIPPEDWRTFRPGEGGYRVEMPGRPAPVTWRGSPNARIYRVRHERSDMTFEAGEFAVQAPNRTLIFEHGLIALDMQYRVGLGETVRKRDDRPRGSDHQHHYRLADGRSVVVRLVVRTGESQRLFVQVVTARRSITPDDPEVRRFFSSASLGVK